MDIINLFNKIPKAEKITFYFDSDINDKNRTLSTRVEIDRLVYGVEMVIDDELLNNSINIEGMKKIIYKDIEKKLIKGVKDA
jgi:hypothetical protein